MRELGNLAREIRGRVSMQDVALRYTDARPGKYIVCPFHAEKTPSMRIYDDSFHCFGCGAHGDVTDFVKGVLGISAMQAVEQINADFGLNLPIGHKMTLRERAEAARAQMAAKTRAYALQKEIGDANDAYFAALDLLLEAERDKEAYAPVSDAESWHPRFAAALQNEARYRDMVEYADARRCAIIARTKSGGFEQRSNTGHGRG